MQTTVTKIAFASFISTVPPAAFGQNIVFLPSILMGNPNMRTNEPPCRQRRLEPFRQNIRDQCKVEVTEHCHPKPDATFNDSESPFFRSLLGPDIDAFQSFLTLDSINPVMDSQTDPFEAIFNDMIGNSLRLFDAMLSGTVELSQGGKYVQSSDSDAGVNQAEQAAERALDVMVTSLIKHTENNVQQLSDVSETNSVAMKHDNISKKLSQFGNELLSQTHRRRLSEEERDPHANIKERLARRLTEYQSDLFYYPDGSVSLYISSLPSFVDSVVLGLGSKDIDECIYSRFKNNDLKGSCHDAVEYFLTAKDTHSIFQPNYRNLTPENNQSSTKSNIFDANNVIFFGDYRVMAIQFYGCLLAVLAVLFIFGCMLNKEEDVEDTETMDESDDYRYIKLSDGVKAPMKNAETVVYVGVPVQVV